MEFFDEGSLDWIIFQLYHYINNLIWRINPCNMRFKRVILEIIVPREDQKQYVLDHCGVDTVPSGWHPETHYHGNDWRQLTPSWPPTPRSYHWTDDGDWILHKEQLYKPCQLCGARIITEIHDRKAETCRECPKASEAFAMGAHARLGANSLIGLLENDLIRKIAALI
jgi:hypothetical protein